MEKPEALELGELQRVFAIGESVERVDQDRKIGLDTLMVLLWLKQEGARSPQGISSELSFNPSKTSRHIERLLKYRLVDEALNMADLRSSTIAVSSKGLRLVAELEHGAGADSVRELLEFSVRFRRAVLHYNQGHAAHRLTDGRARVLLVAHLSGQPMTISELCSRARLRQPSVSMMIKWLTEQGLVMDGKKSSEDGRTRSVLLSPGGEDAACEILNRL